MYGEFINYMSHIIKGCRKHKLYMESVPLSKFPEQLECKETETYNTKLFDLFFGPFLL
jgi:hypothetical protein